MVSIRGPKTTAPTKEYLSALECLWSGRPQTAIERVSILLAEDPDRGDKLQLYRLWIEILAEMGELSTITSLCDHLHLLAIMNPKMSPELMAIRGIAYLEKDDFSAAYLCFRAIKDQNECTYCDELKYRIGQRLNTKQPYSDLVARVSYLEDYFHLKAVAVLAVNKQQKELLESIGKRALKMFPNSPLINEVRMHRAFDTKSWQKMSLMAADLATRFPGNFDYAFYTGFALSQLDLLDQAIAALERSISLGAENDVDITNLLASLYERAAVRQNDSSLSRHAEHYQQKTMRLMEDLGMSYQTAPVSREQSGPQAWMIKLNAAEFFEVRESRESKLKSYMHTIDESAAPGDIVFLVGDDYKKSKHKQWRLAAVFTVSEVPQWHPSLGHQAKLSLMSKPQSAIPFDIKTKTDVESGVIALDIHSIDFLTEAIKEYSEFDTSAARMLENIQRTQAS